MKEIVLILLSLILVLDVKALAVVSDYLEGNTLNVTEGTSKIYSIRLQNPELYETKVGLDYDKGLMKALDYREIYTLPAQSSVRVEFNVTAPEYKKGNDVFNIAYTVHQIGGPDGGGLGFSPKISKGFKLRVVKSPDRLYIDPLHIVFAAMALAFFLFIYRKNIRNLIKDRNKVFSKRKFNVFKSRKIIKWKR